MCKGSDILLLTFDDDEKNSNAAMESFARDWMDAFIVHYKAVNTSLDQYDIDDAVELQDLIEELFDRFLRKSGCDI